ncbi:putative isomerase, Enoyl-CoA hydratase, 3-hydroxyacyl-CoA dehydrogenase [Helianthus anomalus]
MYASSSLRFLFSSDPDDSSFNNQVVSRIPAVTLIVLVGLKEKFAEAMRRDDVKAIVLTVENKTMVCTALE